MAAQAMCHGPLDRAIARYTDPAVVPNRRNWLVLREHSRIEIREWLRMLHLMSDQEIRETLWQRIFGDVHVSIPDNPEIERGLRRLTSSEPISPEALDAYLHAHPNALSGNAEADICPKHREFVQDVSRLRETISVLMDPDTDVVTRLDQVLEGAYHLTGFGKATATTIIECWNDGSDETDGPAYSKWSGHTERAFEVLGLTYRASSAGTTYLNILARQKQMLVDFPRLVDLSDVDLLMYFIDPRGLDSGRRTNR